MPPAHAKEAVYLRSRETYLPMSAKAIFEEDVALDSNPVSSYRPHGASGEIEKGQLGRNEPDITGETTSDKHERKLQHDTRKIQLAGNLRAANSES